MSISTGIEGVMEYLPLLSGKSSLTERDTVMATTRRIVTLALSGALTLGVAPTLAGCSAEQLVQDAVENAVNDATGLDVDLGARRCPKIFPPRCRSSAVRSP